MNTLTELTGQLNTREKEIFSAYAALSRDGERRKAEPPDRSGYRQAFSLDADRVMHSLAYTRYIDKTQVFSLVRNDHITHRVLHVQLVSKIARTIGRFLGLNEDLIEAVALGHDIGHPPFGHEGEYYLSNLCRSEGVGHFCHNVQSVQFLEQVERKGRGWNLCFQTLDGILCHDGEVHNHRLQPDTSKTFQKLDAEIDGKKKDRSLALTPATLEACVVRFSDTIAYIGRDIEDAIRLKLVNRSELPDRSVRILGNTNGKIVYQLVTDVIRESHDHPYMAFSHEVSEALKRLKQFNYERIYLNPKIKKDSGRIKTLFELLFDRFMEDLEKRNRASVIYTHFLEGMDASYMEKHSHGEIVRDFIAGMTDTYFLEQCPEKLRPVYRKIIE